jgi:hypothetical protein
VPLGDFVYGDFCTEHGRRVGFIDNACEEFHCVLVEDDDEDD